MSRPPQTTDVVTLRVELTPDEAWQLAQFCKRSTFDQYRDNATSNDEAYVMIHAMNKIRSQLNLQGYAPR